MAEILISLTIIGVIAAITLPSLQANINESAWSAQRKALYSRMSQAIMLLPSLNGYGILTADETENTENSVAMNFLQNGLSTVLKMNNICNAQNLKECGVPDKIKSQGNSKLLLSNLKTMGGYNSHLRSFTYNTTQSYSHYNTAAAAFETPNGESILVYYNPNCQPNPNTIGIQLFGDFMCANFIYDLNGKKGPNTMGKDIGFMTAFYPVEPEFVSPMPTNFVGTARFTNINEVCKNKDKSTRIPNIDELSSIVINWRLMTVPSARNYYSRTIDVDQSGNTVVWYTFATYPLRTDVDIASNYSFNVKCIKR